MRFFRCFLGEDRPKGNARGRKGSREARRWEIWRRLAVEVELDPPCLKCQKSWFLASEQEHRRGYDDECSTVLGEVDAF